MATLKRIESLEQKLETNIPKAARSNGRGDAGKLSQIESNFEEDKFKEAVLKIKKYIFEGDAIQVVLSQRLKFKITQDPFNIYRALRTINPSPYMYFLKFGDLQVVGSSPEVLVRLEGDPRRVRYSP